jgi:uncharacterized repeat protein (TIGR03803 family)
MQSKKSNPTEKAIFAISLALLLVLAMTAQSVQAQTFKVLHTFHGKDGAFPTGTLIRDSAGNLYSTTSGGGTGGCDKYGCGTVFKMNEVGKELWLNSFKGTNEIDPAAGVLRDPSGNLYGTTIFGGKIRKNCGGVQAGGCGTVYKVDKTGKTTVLYRFEGFPQDGYFPSSVLVQDGTGNLYGVTNEGGTSNFGTVFKVDPSGKESILHDFAGPPDGGGDGASPSAGVIRDAAGNLYGVTGGGGAYGAGTVFELDNTGKETLLYSFTGGADGGGPTRCCFLIHRETFMGQQKEAAAATPVMEDVARFLSCRQIAEAGPKLLCTVFAPSVDALMGKSHSWVRSCETQPGTYTAPLSLAALIAIVMGMPAGLFSSWTRPEKKRCCIASQAGLTVHFLMRV